MVDTRPSPAIPFASDGKLDRSWGRGYRPRLPCNLGTRPSKNFGRPRNEAIGLLNLQLKLAVLLQFLFFVVSISTLKYPLTFSSFLPLLVVWSLSDVPDRTRYSQRTEFRFPRVSNAKNRFCTKCRYYLIPAAFYEGIVSRYTVSESL